MPTDIEAVIGELEKAGAYVAWTFYGRHWERMTQASKKDFTTMVAGCFRAMGFEVQTDGGKDG